MIATEFLSLKSITPNKFLVNYDQENVANKDINLSLSLQSDISSVFKNDKENDNSLVGLIFTATINSDDDLEIPSVSIGYSVKYEFKILELEKYLALDEEEKARLCSSLIFLDFRNKLSQCLSNIGLSKLKLPFGIQEL